MSNTLATMRGRLRNILLDNTGLPLWPDDALNQALWEAIAEHSYLFPRTVRAYFSLSAGQTAVPLFALDTFSGLVNGAWLGPSSATQADLIAVTYAELPTYSAGPPVVLANPIIADPRQISDPAFTGSNIYLQAWYFEGGYLYLRNPASGPEVGSGTLLVELVETYNRPDVAGAITWDGPTHDEALIYLIAQREAYQQLAAWQARDFNQVAAAGARTLVNVPLILAQVELQITRAVKARKSRGLRSRTLDI